MFCVKTDPSQMQPRPNQPGPTGSGPGYPSGPSVGPSPQPAQPPPPSQPPPPPSVQAMISMQQKQNRIAPVAKPVGIDPIETLKEREHR